MAQCASHGTLLLIRRQGFRLSICYYPMGPAAQHGQSDYILISVSTETTHI